jgi:quinol monooxygenase YgiN
MIDHVVTTLPRLTLLLRAAVGLSLLCTGAIAHADCSSDEVGYVASFVVKEGHAAEFETALANLAATVVRVESGVILYAPFRGNDGKYFMMERYENEAARQAHGKSAEVSALFPSLGPHMDGAPDVQPVTAVCP